MNLDENLDMFLQVAAPLLAYIAGYFSGTQNTQNTQTFADCFAPAGLRGVSFWLLAFGC